VEHLDQVLEIALLPKVESQTPETEEDAPPADD
jgi:hypothetical protein